MNIVHLEGVLFGLHKAKEANKDMQAYHKYDILIYKEELKLIELIRRFNIEFFSDKKIFHHTHSVK